jgi:hypothetical protein
LFHEPQDTDRSRPIRLVYRIFTVFRAS